MPSRSYTDFLEADLEADQDELPSEEEEESRLKSLKPSRKRRKTSPSSDEDNHENEEEEEDDDDDEEDKEDKSNHNDSTNDNDNDNDNASKLINPSTRRALAAAHAAHKSSTRTGILYLSHIPPFMKPHALRNLLAPHAPSGLGRIFLTPEAGARRTARLRAGGNRKRAFVDGWVEFARKREAKRAVVALNTRPMARRGFYAHDVWCLRYLSGFKWAHLTEQIANENAEREARMRAEGAASRREMGEFLRNVQRGKVEETRARKRRARGEGMEVVRFEEEQDSGFDGGDGGGGDGAATTKLQDSSKNTKHKTKTKPIIKDATSIDVKRAISSIL